MRRAFDVAREKVGTFSRNGVLVRHLRELERVVERERFDIAVIAVPRDMAQAVVDQVTELNKKVDRLDSFLESGKLTVNVAEKAAK